MKRVLVTIAVIAILLVGAAVTFLALDWRSFQATPLTLPKEGVTVLLAPGQSIHELTTNLDQRGILARPAYFALLARWRGLDRRLQAGEYRVAHGTRPEELLQQMVSGQVVSYSITLVEGWTFKQFLAALAKAPHLHQTVTGLSPAAVMTELGREGEHPEGRFFPDTYRYTRAMADRDILARAWKMMGEHLEREWEQRDPDLPYTKPYEALIMASIVEKETGAAEERAAIAGVFVRRLRRGMLLQTDPTVIYGLGDSFDGNLRRRDLRGDTPYNTYVHGGLPPTPIAMPGLAAIRAALHPAPGKTLYFVARGDGTHEFSSTLEQHNRAVARFQLKGTAPARPKP